MIACYIVFYSMVDCMAISNRAQTCYFHLSHIHFWNIYLLTFVQVKLMNKSCKITMRKINTKIFLLIWKVKDDYFYIRSLRRKKCKLLKIKPCPCTLSIANHVSHCYFQKLWHIHHEMDQGTMKQWYNGKQHPWCNLVFDHTLSILCKDQIHSGIRVRVKYPLHISVSRPPTGLIVSVHSHKMWPEGW